MEFSVRPFKWWDETLTQLHKRQKVAYNQFRKSRSEQAHDRLVEARQVFRREAPAGEEGRLAGLH